MVTDTVAKRCPDLRKLSAVAVINAAYPSPKSYDVRFASLSIDSKSCRTGRAGQCCKTTSNG